MSAVSIAQKIIRKLRKVAGRRDPADAELSVALRDERQLTAVLNELIADGVITERVPVFRPDR